MQLIYTTRLRKYKHRQEHALTRQRLVEDYALGDNPDVLYSFADALYTNFRFADCYAITSRCVFVCLWGKLWGIVEREKKLNFQTRPFFIFIFLFYLGF